MKKVLFIDRDGTLIIEPPVTYQIDSLEKLSFVPWALVAMSRIAELDYELVMVSNQDGLGTESFPEETFYPAQNKMLEAFESVGVKFDALHIDPSLPEENLPTRKPGTAMLTSYMTGEYDLANSYVIGDRLSDVQLAANLGCGAIYFNESGQQGVDAALVTNDWRKIYEFLRLGKRRVSLRRTTRETDISLTLDLDGALQSSISTGYGFADHMIEQIVHHGGIGLQIEARGDSYVDEHHTIEDTAILLGEAMAQALGDKRGLERYGFCLPMDECDALVMLDFGGRIDFAWRADFQRERIGDVPTEMFAHFFKSFAQGARCNLHIEARGENEHHKIEAIFKAFARALKCAIRRDALNVKLPSSKGLL
ncbi:Histidinol-phosphatase [Mucinivorans hirudinis]|uniref:Histidine biosynthesis bifunctional protein HisB n=1 Tax=Mucinivorans hirudinis TaxID=1433126 RepID=A0A060R857_9BACT|nr:Histidinol-phosphatase [Mucinivorans hirudinis]